jgi:hypothetical protein
VILWDTDSTWQFSHLYLVAPKTGDERTAEAYWQVEIGHPAVALHLNRGFRVYILQHLSAI